MIEKNNLLYGEPVSEGIAIAKAYLYETPDLKLPKETHAQGDVKAQCNRFAAAKEQAKKELVSLYESLVPTHPKQAEIFMAHCELLDDEEMSSETESAIKEDELTAESAVDKVYNQYAELLGRVEDPLIAGRAADILDVKRRVLCILMGKEEKRLDRFTEDVIVVAHDLLPSDTANLDLSHVKGIITETGGANSHCAILARSFSLPAILGAKGIMEQAEDGQMLVVDGILGKICLSPSEEERVFYEKKRMEWEKEKQAEDKYLLQTATTKDGVEILLGINVGSDKYEVKDAAYDFVGLFRTEFLYMENDHMPTEEEQFAAYRNVVEKAHGKCVTLRTLDIGGDKTLSYFSMPKEDNPFLGERAIRLCFAHPEILQTQLRAALRASAYGTLQLMFPMVGSLEDIGKAKEMVREAMAQLDAKGQQYDHQIRLGVMMEVPSLALISDLVAKEVDFASIGSNDLTQYVCAADRMNPTMGAYYQSDSPAMCRLMEYVFSSFAKEKKSVSVCGEMAGTPKNAALLVGLGARKLSMNYASLAAVKAELKKHTLEELEKMASEAKKALQSV